MYTRAHAHIHAYIGTHIHTCTRHTDTHLHTHTHIQTPTSIVRETTESFCGQAKERFLGINELPEQAARSWRSRLHGTIGIDATKASVQRDLLVGYA